MGWFTDREAHGENRIQIFKDLIQDKQEQYEALEDVEGSPETEAHRHELFEQIKQLELNLIEAKEHAERSEEQGQSREDHGRDLFED